ncbi:hypothetical protein ALC56_12354 [Trachymyrmex septentrionalis]|uniref:Uncharacterized protein n=1 Tax=Trachymyrmex septentrionalis TaxID=34720 RepID=A0A195F0F7_9HYME|nr:hypothetical protein ALC56_12354 [Trachymyrmex septentrionalis]
MQLALDLSLSISIVPRPPTSRGPKSLGRQVEGLRRIPKGICVAIDIPFRQRVDIDEGDRTKRDDSSLSSPLDAFSKFEDIRKWGINNRSDTELARMMRAAVAAGPLLLSRAHRYLPTYSTARRTGGCKWYIHYYPQSNGWNLLGDKLLRPPTLLAEFRDSIRAETERDTF